MAKPVAICCKAPDDQAYAKQTRRLSQERHLEQREVRESETDRQTDKHKQRNRGRGTWFWKVCEGMREVKVQDVHNSLLPKPS